MRQATDPLELARDRIEELEVKVDQLVAELEAKEQEAAGAHAQLARLQRQQRESASAPTPAPDKGPALGKQYESVDAWVDEWLYVTVERAPSGNVRWCRQWREHPEAALRIEQMFADYAKCMAAPTVGWSNFIRNSLDYYLPTLTSPTGPFAACHPRQHESPVFLTGSSDV